MEFTTSSRVGPAALEFSSRRLARQQKTRTVHASAPARVALAGNPSDGFGGRTLSLALGNYRARVTVRESDEVEILPAPQDTNRFTSVDDLVTDVARDGYYGGLRLLTAAVKRLAQYCRQLGAEVGERGVSIQYDTRIPRGVGLGGSSAIVAAAIAGLMKLWHIDVEVELLPALILSVETDELGIPAGLQDRVAQVYGGLTFMDFDPRIVGDGGGRYESLETAQLPPLFVAHVLHAAEPSDVVHSELRQRFHSGERGVIEGMAELALLATKARDAVLARDPVGLGNAMDASFELRRSITVLDPRHIRMVETARELGAPANYAGSGGAIVGILRDDSHLAELGDALRDQGVVVARCRPGEPAGVDADPS
jgi:galactokinase/mevalonate kinase-like predicted kinase